MRLTKLAALSLLLSAGSMTVPLERAMANDAVTEPSAAQGAPAPMAQAAPPPAAPNTPAPAAPGTPPPPPPAASAPAAPASAVTHSNVNLRNGPGTSFTVVTLIPAGSSVEVNECKSGWCEATFHGQNGYIIESSIAPGAPGAAARARPRPAPGYPAPGYYAGGPPPGYEVPPPDYYPPPVAYYPYGPYYRPYWGWRHRYWRRW